MSALQIAESSKLLIIHESIGVNFSEIYFSLFIENLLEIVHLSLMLNYKIFSLVIGLPHFNIFPYNIDSNKTGSCFGSTMVIFLLC